MDDETGMKIVVTGLKQIMPVAEKISNRSDGLFNSKIDHQDYMADKVPWGIELCKRLDSPISITVRHLPYADQ